MPAISPCIECRSLDTDIFWGDDGHFRKRCNDCDYVGGPYISQQSSGDVQASLSDF